MTRIPRDREWLNRELQRITAQIGQRRRDEEEAGMAVAALEHRRDDLIDELSLYYARRRG